MGRMNRRKAIQVLGGGAASALAGFPAILNAQNRRPNFIFMMTDDQRWDAMSCAGNKILKTPNMDRLAAGGVRFTEGFVTNPLCSPSRGTILTGLYSHAHGVTTNGGPSHHLKPGVATYTSVLQKSGYYSAALGKWHVATMPTNLGFDHWCILPGQGLYHDPIMIANGGRVQFRGYVDDIIVDQALETLRSRPKDKPFSMICNFKAPHRAWEPAKRFEKVYDDIEIPEPPTFHTSLDDRPDGIRHTDMLVGDMPDFRQRGVPADLPPAERKRLNFQVFLKNYYRTLLAVDENLGRLLDYLDKNGLTENTVFVYTGDNGFFLGEYGMFDKRLMYEPSIRVPMLIRHPASIRSGQVDSRNMVLNNDVAHTILDIAGIQRPKEMEHHGMSWQPILANSQAQWRNSWLYQNFEYPGPHCAPKARGVRTQRWKLIHYLQEPQAWEMFDLQNDPQERRNLYNDAAHARQRDELHRELLRLRKETNDDFSEDGTPTPACGRRMAPRRS